MFQSMCVLCCVLFLSGVVGLLVYQVALLSQRLLPQTEEKSVDLKEAFEYARYLVGIAVGRHLSGKLPQIRFKELSFFGGVVKGNTFYISEEYRYSPDHVVQILCRLISRMLVKKYQSKEGWTVKEVNNPVKWLKAYMTSRK